MQRELMAYVVNGVYRDTTPAEIASDLCQQHLAEDGYSVAGWPESPRIAQVCWHNQHVRYALDRLAEMLGGRAIVDGKCILFR